MKLHSLEDLLKVQAHAEKEKEKFHYTVRVCGESGCNSNGAELVIEKFNELLDHYKLRKTVNFVRTGCFGLCAEGPIVIIDPEGAFYTQVKVEDVDEIIKTHLIEGKVATDYVYPETLNEDGTIKNYNEVSFYKKQKRTVLHNCGVIDPKNIVDYIREGGYQALHKALTEMTPKEVIDTVKKSGLRGRGGGGFPTGRKWEFASVQKADKRYVCCNADEGDPGAFMDRSVLEGDPHSVVEAMAIAAYAIGSDQGYVYIRAEYPIAVIKLKLAIEQAKEYGLLGENIFGTGFNFDLQVRLGAGAFVCGEETALLTSIEGNRGEPHARPPFPAVKGLFGKPTILNNVETYANIPQIIMKGADWFASTGTEGSKGTKVFALGGKIARSGLIEVPMGTTVRDALFEIGGGIANGKKFKAAQTGGPSGGCIPESKLDTPIDYDNLVAIGSMMGSGGMIVMDEDNCMVDVAKYFLEFICGESCGKCVSCRIGSKRLLEMLEKVTTGEATLQTIEDMRSLAVYMQENALCALGKTAPNPVLSTLKYFENEYLEHINEKKCHASVCKALLNYVIDPEKCIGCGLCRRACPTGAITGEIRHPHTINTTICAKCGQCVTKCTKHAISVK